MLEAHDLAARRGPLLLFEGLSIRVPAGQALVVQGRNGSGKTTLLRILAGLSQPAAGRVTWHGREVGRHDPVMRADVCFAGHVPALKDELTASENLHALVALAGGGADRPTLRRALADVGLDARRNLPARALSQGQRRRIALARLGIGRQRLWLLDEPATALDADGMALLAALVARHLARDGTLVAATHQPLTLPADRVRTLELG